MKVRRRRTRSIKAIGLAALLAVFLCAFSLDAFAAGQINVQITDLEGLGDDFPGFTFELYEVGGYDGSDFILIPDYADVDVKIPNEEEYNKHRKEGDPTWEEAWLKSAATLANHIKHPAEGEPVKTPVATYEKMPGEMITFDSDKNALYLLVCNTVRYQNRYYTAAPMFVRTLNGEETYLIDAELKIRIEPVVFEHSLVKIWRDDDNRAGVRPDAIEMGIYYGDQLIDRVTLGDGVWTYKWTSEEEGDTYCYISDDNVRKYFKPGDDDNAWAVREFTRKSQISDSRARAEAYKLAYYSPEYEKNTSDTMESFIVNNPYSDKGRKLPDVDTGDTNNIKLWAGLAGVSVLLLILLLVARKRNKRVSCRNRSTTS